MWSSSSRTSRESTAVVSGIFFGGLPATATYFTADTTTQGNWIGNLWDSMART